MSWEGFQINLADLAKVLFGVAAVILALKGKQVMKEKDREKRSRKE